MSWQPILENTPTNFTVGVLVNYVCGYSGIQLLQNVLNHKFRNRVDKAAAVR